MKHIKDGWREGQEKERLEDQRHGGFSYIEHNVITVTSIPTISVNVYLRTFKNNKSVRFRRRRRRKKKTKNENLKEANRYRKDNTTLLGHRL